VESIWSTKPLDEGTSCGGTLLMTQNVVWDENYWLNQVADEFQISTTTHPSMEKSQILVAHLLVASTKSWKVL
jgi:hypothetical protein